MDWRLRRGLGLDLETTEEMMKDTCHDNRCTSCAHETPPYQAICQNFMLECLRVRIMTRMQYNVTNKYILLPGWPSGLTDELQRYVDNPIRFWIDETSTFYTLGDRLVALHEPLIKPTGIDKNSKSEARLYLSHASSIQKVISNIRKCDASPL
eukprot:4987110-Prymnesium_polylepis.5